MWLCQASPSHQPFVSPPFMVCVGRVCVLCGYGLGGCDTSVCVWLGYWCGCGWDIGVGVVGISVWVWLGSRCGCGWDNGVGVVGISVWVWLGIGIGVGGILVCV